MTIAPSPPFATVLRAYRLAAGLTQEALAERAGLSVRAVSDLERGRRRLPHPHTVRALARALRLPAAERARLETAGRRPADAAASVAPEPRPLTNLPVQITSFIGRERELAEIARLLTATRLLTVTGAGGCGKTRLALQVVAGLLADYSDGVWFVDLAPLTDPTLVGQAIASVLGLQEAMGQSNLSRLQAALKSKHLLLVLDNCEHLIEACAQVADALLRGCPGVTLLATSREALGIAGETVWRVPSLSVPNTTATDAPLSLDELAAFEAIRLFVDRATAVQPHFALTTQNAPTVDQICRRLDGIPLAIELAAARVRLLTVEQIATRLDDRFRLLTGGGRTAVPRQQTLQATIDWSHALLTEPERVLFRRLAVFVGGWTLEAAEAVAGDQGPGIRGLGMGTGDGGASTAALATGPLAHSPTCPLATGDVLDLLGQLVDKSLVLVDEHDGAARYHLLETMRQYGLDRLQAADELVLMQRRHLAWCLALAARAEPHLGAADQLHWLACLAAEHDNLRAALTWSLDDDPATGLQLAGCLWLFWRARSLYVEGEQWLDRLLALAPDGTLARAKALQGAGLLARTHAHTTTARARLEESLPLCRALGDRRLLALTLRELGYLLPEMGDLAQGRALLEEGLDLVRADEDERGLGPTLFMLAMVSDHEGDATRARALGEESLRVLRRVGDRWMICRALNGLGLTALHAGDCARAEALTSEALPLAQELGSPGGMAVLHIRLAWTALWQGDAERATLHYEACRMLAERHAMDTHRGHALTGLGRVAQVRGEGARATALLTEGLALYIERGVTLNISEAQYGLGLVARDQGDWVQATDWLCQSLAMRQAADNRPGIATCLEGLATVAARQGQPVRTARLLGAAEALRQAIRSPMPLVERPAFEAAVQTARAAMGQEAFDAAWAAGQALPLEEAIAGALMDDDLGSSPPGTS
jgi:non-specific serine/threonine protein kinase